MTETHAPPLTTPQVSVVIPCLNEAETIAECVRAAAEVLAESGLEGEVIVVDNDSDDGSAELAAAAGATVIHEPSRGYGSAYRAGLRAARGSYIVMADADLTYDFREIPRFVRELEDGAELVVGNRKSRPGAMPWLSRVGNPILSRFLNVLYRTKVRDVHCGMRAVRREVLPILDLRTTGMEFASEMVIRAAREKLDVREFPIELHPRVGRSKLSPFRDGWRHLRLILVYNPNFLFLLPGVVLMLAGAIVVVLVFAGLLYVHSLIVGCLLIVLGVQATGLGVCARAYGLYHIGEQDRLLQALGSRVKLEHGLLVAGVLVSVGVALLGVVIDKWVDRGFGKLEEERLTILAATAVILGAQVFFTSFLLAILGLRRRHAES